MSTVRSWGGVTLSSKVVGGLCPAFRGGPENGV